MQMTDAQFAYSCCFFCATVGFERVGRLRGMYLALALIAVVAALLVWGWERARGRWVAPMLEEVLKSRELVLVTGGSRGAMLCAWRVAAGTPLIRLFAPGLGLEFAHAFAERNFDVVLVARSAAQLEEAKEEVAARHGVEVFALTCDLAASGVRMPVARNASVAHMHACRERSG